MPNTNPALDDKEIMLQSVACKPHPRQMTFQEMEFNAFIHFGVNTFTGKEWGNGFEDPKIFNPTNLDTDQWCEAMKAAGMKMAVISIKHHDGFCLWQTRYTSHSVASSTWRNGKGDVLKDLTESLKKYDIKLGIYLSPADLYQIESPGGLYGNGSKYSERIIPRPVEDRPFKDKRSFKYLLDDYNEYFMNQLFELLTEYGPVYEVWFDGAHPKRKGGQTYTDDQWYELIRNLAPEAVIAIAGPDVRWCGNEGGKTRESEWSVIPVGGDRDNRVWPDMMDQDLGSMNKLNERLSKGGFLHWYPAETNTSIRHGWFWRDESQYVKTTEEILDVWYRSVGGNSVFLLNIPPNRDGLFSDRDVKVLKEIGDIIHKTFRENLAEGAMITASSTRGEAYAAGNVLDGDPSTCWMPPDWTRQAELIIKLSEKKQFNRIVLQEHIRDFSQRIARFAVDVMQKGQWQQVAEATTIGYKRICRIPTIESDQIRIRIKDSRVSPTLSSFGIHFEPVRATVPEIIRDKQGNISIYCNPPGPDIHYSLDGSQPGPESPLYHQVIPFPLGGIVKSAAFHPKTGENSEVASARFDICPVKWRVITVSSEQEDNKEYGSNAIDGDSNTNWITRWRPEPPPHPHYIAIDLGEELDLKGFTYTPRRDARANGTILDYQFFVSQDGENWGEPEVQGQFENIINNPAKQFVRFSKPQKGRYIKLVALTEIRGNPWASAAEVGVITR